MKRRTLTGAVIAAAIAVLSCAQLQQFASSAEGMMAFGQDLAKAYPGENIELEINAYYSGDTAVEALIVYFINSSYSGLTRAEQEAQAREIAQFTKDNYASAAEIEVIVIVFRNHSEALVLSSDVDAAFEFETSALD